MCQGIMQHRRELMQIFIGFRSRHRKLRPKDIKGRICLVVIEDKQQFVGHRRQFAFATTAWFAPARSGLEPFFIRFLLRCLVDVAEDRQQVVELGLGQAGQGFHLTLVSDLHAHWLASSMAFWRTVYLSLYWGTTLIRQSSPSGARPDAHNRRPHCAPDTPRSPTDASGSERQTQSRCAVATAGSVAGHSA